ncbi:hypothetical protein PGT21_013227 [Puccinia graminis f. sp. tritici]|uniref:Uncharacterized protein n=1 Tax=Puccinia graminis f. sp. tritici TaxID=56615 RepID=A0A5B0PPX7_PUCGR|nr:hypothetical protein PGT21_013227 [Puccinia graminis f. sp. tritici]
MAGTSPLNNSSKNSNVENVSNKSTAGPETNLLDYNKVMTRGTHSAQQQPSCFEDLGSTDTVSNPSSTKSEPVPSYKSISSPSRSRRYHSGQPRPGDRDQSLQQAMEYFCPSSRKSEPLIDENGTSTSYIQPRRDPTLSGQSQNAQDLRELDSQRGVSGKNQSQHLAITQTAHKHTVSPSPAPQRSTRQLSDVTSLGTGQAPQQNNPLPPPPPPSTQPPSEVIRHKPLRQAHQYYQQPRPHYQQEGY